MEKIEDFYEDWKNIRGNIDYFNFKDAYKDARNYVLFENGDGYFMVEEDIERGEIAVIYGKDKKKIELDKKGDL